MIQTKGKQILRGGICVNRAKLGIENHDSCRYRIEEIRRIEVFERGYCPLNPHDRPSENLWPGGGPWSGRRLG